MKKMQNMKKEKKKVKQNGEKDAKIKMVKELLKIGLSVEKIEKVTGLTKEEIEKI